MEGVVAVGLRCGFERHLAGAHCDLPIDVSYKLNRRRRKGYIPARVQFDVVADVVSERLLELQCGGQSERLGSLGLAAGD